MAHFRFKLWFFSIEWHTKCTKLKHASEKDALKMIVRQAHKGNIRYHYYCTECVAWHLTKMEQSPQ